MSYSIRESPDRKVDLIGSQVDDLSATTTSIISSTNDWTTIIIPRVFTDHLPVVRAVRSGLEPPNRATSSHAPVNLSGHPPRLRINHYKVKYKTLYFKDKSL